MPLEGSFHAYFLGYFAEEMFRTCEPQLRQAQRTRRNDVYAASSYSLQFVGRKEILVTTNAQKGVR